MSARITVEHVDGTTWSVDVDHELFAVTVEDADAAELAAGDTEALLRASFEFLLEREPVDSILRIFDLTVIERYFPEWREAMRSRFS
jgi:hypothetical protein